MHCIQGAYIDRSKYHDYIDRNSSPIFDIIKLISSKGITITVYKKRVDIILNFNKIENGVIDCNANVSNTIGVILHIIPSITCQTSCSKCNNILPVITSNLEPLFERGMNAVKESIRQYILENRRRCQKCYNRTDVSMQPSYHLAIDIEYLQSNLYSKRKADGQNVADTSLLDIPIDINIGNIQYILVGVIEHIMLGESGHYRPYIRTLNNTWELHDEIATQSRVKKLTNKEQKSKRKNLYCFM